MPCRVRASSMPASKPVDHRAEADAARGVRLGIEEDFGVDDIVRRRPVEIGGRQVAEIRLGPEHVGAAIIDVEKVLQVREIIGGAHLLDARERDFDAVALRQREHQFGLEAALDMHVQFGLGQAGDEGVEVGHAGKA